MWEPLRIGLDELEFDFKHHKPNATDEEIRKHLLTAPYTKKEVDDYMVSKERKESRFYKTWLKNQGK